jgi:hypothetical protein
MKPVHSAMAFGKCWATALMLVSEWQDRRSGLYVAVIPARLGVIRWKPRQSRLSGGKVEKPRSEWKDSWFDATDISQPRPNPPFSQSDTAIIEV